MADSSLVVGVLSARMDLDTSGLQAGLRQTDAAMTRAAQHGEESANKATSAWKGMGAALGGLAIAKFGVDSVKAYGEAEQSAVRLQDAFARFPKLGDSSADAIGKISTALAAKSRFDDDAINSGATILAQFGLTGKTIEAALPHLVDYAAKTGKDIPTAAAALQKAALGSTKPLKELGITGFKATGDRARDMATVLGLVGQKTSGFAETDVKTVQGSLEQLKNRFGEVQEAVGGALLPILQTATPVIGKIADGAQKAATWFAALPGPMRTAALAVAGILAAAKVGIFAKLTAGLATFRTNVGTIRAAETGVGRFGAALRSAGMAAGTLGKGLFAALGGPIGAALIGVTVAIGLFQSANERSKQAVEEHNRAVEEFSQTLNQVTGELTGASIADLTNQVKEGDSAFKAAGSSVAEMAAAIAKGGTAFYSAQQQLLDFNKAAVDNVNATGQSSSYIDIWAQKFGISADAIKSAAIRGGDAQIAMVEALGKHGIAADNAAATLNNYRKSIEDVVPGLKTIDNAQSVAAQSAQQAAKAFDDIGVAAARTAGVKAPEALIAGLEKAAGTGRTARDVLLSLGASSQQADAIVSALGPKLADTFAPATEAANGTATSVGKVGAAATEATPPVDGMKKALDGISSAATDADTATQFLQATLDRMAGRNQAAIDALRLEQAALRGIGKASRDEAAAKDEVITKTQALADARSKATDKDFTAADKVLAIRAAERDLQDALVGVTEKTVASTVAQEAAARAMEQQVQTVITSTLSTKGLAAAQAAGAAKMTELRAAFIASFSPADIASGKAKKVADQLGLIPKNVKAAVTVEDKANPGVAGAKKKIASVEDRLARVTVADLTRAGVTSAKSRIGGVEDRLARVTAADLTGAGVNSAKSSVRGVPDKDAAITATDKTGPGVNSAKTSLASVPPVTNANLTITTNYVEVGTKPAPGLLGRVGVRVPQALGGAVVGGQPGIDSVPLLGMPGEHMLTTADVGRLGGQGGVYRFRRALASGLVGRYAGGGRVPGGAALAGVGAYQPGERQGNIRGAFADLAAAVADFAQSAADARSKAADSRAAWSQATAAQREAAHNAVVVQHEQTAKVAQVQKDNAEKLVKAQEALNVAQHSKAAGRAAAITKATNALHAVQTKNTDALHKATNAQKAANTTAHNAVVAADARVKSTRRVSDADTRAANIATARSRVEAHVQTAQAGLRRMLDGLGAAFDRNKEKLGGLTDKLADLKGKAADVTSSIQGNVTGIGGGILGSDQFTGSSTTAKDIIAGLTADKAVATGFDASIAKLIALGLKPQAAEQVANADPTGRGGVVASALAGATKEQIKTINELMAAQAAIGAKTGGRVAGAEYGAQIAATNLQISATNLQLKVEAAEAAAIGNTIAAATRAAMTGQKVIISISNQQLQGVVKTVVATEQSAAVRHAAGYR